ncbi:MAG: acyl carrier protein [Bacteroidales bacterium]|nr:acyl carrier protein [Bacteroidales bacterium]
MITYPEFQAMLAKQLRLTAASEVQPTSRIQKDLGADSLDILQLLMKLEDNYGYSIPDEELARFETVADVLAYLRIPLEP